jgi:hypothetical protein
MPVLQLPRVVMAVKDEAPSKSFDPFQVQRYNSTLGNTRMCRRVDGQLTF